MNGLLSHVLRLDRKLVQVFLILAVLVGSLALGRHPSTRYLLLFAALFAGVFLWRWTEISLVLLPVVALLVPFAISTGTYTTLNAAFLLSAAVIGIWLAKMILGRQLKLRLTPVTVPALLLVAITTLALISGNIKWDYFAGMASMAAQFGGWAIYVLSVLLLLITGEILADARYLKLLLWPFTALGSVYVLEQLIPQFSFLSSFYQNGAVGSLFWVWIVAMSAGQAMFNRHLPLMQRVYFYGSVILTLALGWKNREWVSGFLPGMAGLTVLIYLLNWRVGVFVTLVGFIGLAIIKPELIQSVVTTNLYSISTRQVAGSILLEIIKINPLLGLGPANYYFYTPLYSLIGYYVKFNSHNQYLDLLAQIGILGTAVFAWLMVAAGRIGLRLRNTVGSGFERGYVYGCLAGLVGTLVAGTLGDWFLPFIYNIGMSGFRSSLLVWLFLGGLVALDSIYGRKTSAED